MWSNGYTAVCEPACVHTNVPIHTNKDSDTYAHSHTHVGLCNTQRFANFWFPHFFNIPKAAASPAMKAMRAMKSTKTAATPAPALKTIRPFDQTKFIKFW